jgi:hypothetical protein
VLSAWFDAEQPASGGQIFVELLPATLTHASEALQARLLFGSNLALPDDAFDNLSPDLWRQWLKIRLESLPERECLQPWRIAPLAVMKQALIERSPVVRSVRELVWQRAIEIAIAHVEALRTTADNIAAEWIRACPAELAPDVAERAVQAAWLRATDAFALELMRLMHSAVATRVPRWHAAYECLNQLVVERRRFEVQASLGTKLSN